MLVNASTYGCVRTKIGQLRIVQSIFDEWYVFFAKHICNDRVFGGKVYALTTSLGSLS